MKKNLLNVVAALITTILLAFSFTFAQNNVASGSDLGFFGQMSVRIYCTFAGFIPGTDTSACTNDVVIVDERPTPSIGVTGTSTTNFTNTRATQISNVISQGLQTSPRIVYVPVKGDKGDNGTTTIIYQSIPGATMYSPAAYISAGGNNPRSPYQTTVPGDIYSTFVHFLQIENIFGPLANIATINASTTNTDKLVFANGTGTNLFVTNASLTNATTTSLFASNATVTNIYADYASISAATTTYLYSYFANLVELLSTNATISNATTTNLFATNASITNATATNIFANFASVTFATTTYFYADYASTSQATTTYLFAVWAKFMNLFVSNLQFDSATGTNLQVANASTTNFAATGTTFLANALVSSSTLSTTTIQNGEIKSGNATVTTLVTNRATATDIFSARASITSATTTNLYALILNAISATFTNLVATNATITNSTSTKIFVTNASVTNATVTTLFVNNNCFGTNIFCNGGNDTGAIVGTDAPLTLGTLNAGNIQFITGDLGAPSVTPGAVKMVIETGLPAEGTGAVRITNALKVGQNIVASGTITATNIVATSTFILANGTITNATATKIFATSASITNATTTSFFAAIFNALSATFTNLVATNATLTNATSTNVFAVNGSVTNLSATNATITNATATKIFATNGTVNNLQTVNSTATNATITNAFVGDVVMGEATTSFMFVSDLKANMVNIFGGYATFTNATSSNLFANVLNAASSAFANLIATNATITNATSTSLFATWFGTTNAAIDNLVTVNATFTNATSTNLFANIFGAQTGRITSLDSTNATITNATATDLSVLNLRPSLGNATITVFGSLVPSASSTFDLGSAAFPWRDLYVSSSTVNIGGNRLSSASGTILWNGAPIVVSTASGTTALGELTASTTATDNLLATDATFTNATSTNLFAGWVNALVARFGILNFGIAIGDIVQTRDVLTTNITATGTANFSNIVVTNATVTNATFTKVYADIIETDSVSYNGIIGNLATISKATVTDLFANNFNGEFLTATNSNVYFTNTEFATATKLYAGNAEFLVLKVSNLESQNLTISGGFTSHGAVQLGIDDNIINNVGTGENTQNYFGTGASSTNVFGTDNSLNLFYGTTTIQGDLFLSTAAGNDVHIGNTTGTTTVHSMAVFNQLFRAFNAVIDNLVITNTTIANATITNATTTNLFATNFVSKGIFSLATGTIASTTITQANVANLNVTNSTAEKIAFGTQVGRASSTTFAANGNITNVDNSSVFNITTTAGSLTITLNNPTDTTPGKIVYVNNVGINSFTILGSVITPDTGRTFVWTGTKWSVNADGVGSAPTSSTIKQVLSADQIKTDETQTLVTDLSWNVSARETWYYSIVGSISGGDNTNNGMEVQITAPSGATSCSATLTNFDLDNNWTTSTCNGIISGTSNWTAQNNFKVEGIFTTGSTGGSARFLWAKNSAGGNNLVLAASSTVLTAVKMNGADLAEVYYSTNGTIGYGEIVSLEGTGVSQVVKSQSAYDTKAIGIVSTRPGHILGEADGTGSPVVVGLSGRVPVKVTTANGDIKPGDFITTSDIAGVGMKATKAGRVVGKALTGFAGNGEEIGIVQVFIQNTYFEGDENEGLADRITLATGAIADKFTNNIKKSFENLSNVMLSMTLWVNEVKANVVGADKLNVKELCIGGECFTESDMKEFRAYLNSKKDAVVTEEVAPTVTEEVTGDENTSAENDTTNTETVAETILPEMVSEDAGEVSNTATEVGTDTQNLETPTMSETN